jgi:hypothetical protein
MLCISQSELDKTFAGCREKVSPEFSKPLVPKFHKFPSPYSEESPDNPCAISQDELDRTLLQKKS